MKSKGFFLILFFSLAILACAFCTDMMEFSVQWRMTNSSIAELEIIPYSQTGSLDVDSEGNKTKALEVDSSGSAEVCCVYYRTNVRGTHTIRFHASSLYCEALDQSFGYTLLLGEDLTSHPVELVATSSSTVDNTYADVTLYNQAVAVAKKYIFVYATIDEIDEMPPGDYKATIQVEVIAT